METPDAHRPGDADFLRTTRAAYDIVAESYAAKANGGLAGLPLERALLTAFTELAGPVGPILDAGCGTGHVTAYLRSLGTDASGVDLSPAMIAAARRDYPDLRFDLGSMTALDRPDGRLGGVLAMYSVIHIPPSELPGVFAEFHRVVAPGGWVMLGFQFGDGTPRHITEWFGHDISLYQHRHPPELVAETLTDAGFAVQTQAKRQPDGINETVPRAYVLAQRSR